MVKPVASGASFHAPQQPLRVSQRPRLIIPASAAVLDAASAGPLILNSQVLHSATQEQIECVGSMRPFFEDNILPLLSPVEKLWQPSDFLPDPSSEGFIEQVADLRARTAEISDELMMVLVGDMVTEEALPTYMAMLNTLDGVRDESGSDQHPYARWTRQWIAEENRHGDLLNK
jgi:acyl-[acyl-carrier-protein] desaturase